MPSYIVINRSRSSIQIDVPTRKGSGASFIVPQSTSIDIYPFVGSIEVCRSLSFIKMLAAQNLIEVLESL